MIGKFIIDISWIAALAAAAYFLYSSNPRQRKAGGLALLWSGLGHFWLKKTHRGLYFMGVILVLFLAGMIMADFRNVSPFDRHPLWGLAQAPGGLMTGLAALATSSLKIIEENGLYSTGCLYTGCAGLLNILAACDAWDLAEKADETDAAPEQETQAA